MKIEVLTHDHTERKYNASPIPSLSTTTDWVTRTNSLSISGEIAGLNCGYLIVELSSSLAVVNIHTSSISAGGEIRDLPAELIEGIVAGWKHTIDLHNRFFLPEIIASKEQLEKEYAASKNERNSWDVIRDMV